jgi:hypothetical protein
MSNRKKFVSLEILKSDYSSDDHYSKYIHLRHKGENEINKNALRTWMRKHIHLLSKNSKHSNEKN